MKILAFDTSSKNCSVSIVEVDENENFEIIAQDNNEDERTHSVKLMPMIDNMFKSSNLSLDNIDLLACCLGPGSFTGIRIGIATVKAFSDSKKIPTVGVTSLESLAYNVENSSLVCSLIDCKHGNVYSGIFEINSNSGNTTYTQVQEDVSDEINAVLDNLKSVCSRDLENKKLTFVGDGSVLYKDLINEKFADYDIEFSDNNIQSSISLAKSAYYRFNQGLAGDSNNISPIYLRKSQAEQATNK